MGLVFWVRIVGDSLSKQTGAHGYIMAVATGNQTTCTHVLYVFWIWILLQKERTRPTCMLLHGPLVPA